MGALEELHNYIVALRREEDILLENIFTQYDEEFLLYKEEIEDHLKQYRNGLYTGEQDNEFELNMFFQSLSLQQFKAGDKALWLASVGRLERVKREVCSALKKNKALILAVFGKYMGNFQQIEDKG